MVLLKFRENLEISVNICEWMRTGIARHDSGNLQMFSPQKKPKEWWFLGMSCKMMSGGMIEK